MPASGILFHISGPAKIIVNDQELGFCERSPEIQFDVEYEGTLNAVSGTRFGGIYTYQGAEADIDVLLTRFDYSVLSSHIYPRLSVAVSGKTPVGIGIPNRHAASSPDYSDENVVASVSLKIEYTTSSGTLEFPSCLIRAFRLFDIGPIPRKAYIKFRAVRKDDNTLGSITGA